MSLSNPSLQKDVSIIIPVHNRRDLTERCLESIAGSTNQVTYEVIVVDNGSTDGTRELLDAIDGDFTVVANKLNEGFASACNRGARIANGRYLLFLNNDTEVPDNYLDVLTSCAAKHPEVAAIGAKLIYPNGKAQHAGIAFDEEGTPFHIFQNFAADHPAICESREMAAVTAACMLIEKKHFESVFGFDASYQNGFEDVDLCLKLAQKGLRSYYCADCTILHHEESTEGRKTHDAENMILFATRWTGLIEQDDNKYLAPYGLEIQQKGNGWAYVETQGESNAIGTNPQIMLDTAQKKYLEGRHEEAAKILNSIVSKRLTLGTDDEFETWQLLGNCMARLNKAEEAEEAYLHAAETDFNSERPFLGLGSVAMLQENWTAAQYGFLAALSRNPETTRGEFGLGISLAARGRHSDSLKHFKKVVEREPRNSEAVFYLYRSSMEANKPQEAIAALSRYLEENTDDVDFWFHLPVRNGSPDLLTTQSRRAAKS